MPSDFDKIFAEAQARRDAQTRKAEQERLAQERLVAVENQAARSIAEPYLRDLGPQVARQLLDLKVPPQRQRVSREVWGLFGGPREQLVQSEEFWRLYQGHYNLLLTTDGLFIQDIRLPVPQGVEALLRGLIIGEPNAQGMLAAPHYYHLYDGQLYVDACTERLCICTQRSLGVEMGYERELYEFTPWIAEIVLNLADQAARNRGR